MKYLLTVFIVLLVSIAASAQLAVGIQGGANFASVQFRDRDEFLVRDVKLLETYQFGGVVRYVNEKHVALQLEFNVSHKGWRDINDTSNVQTRRIISYYEVPFLAQFIVGSKKVRIVIEGGPYLGYARSSEVEEKNLDTGERQNFNYDFREDIDNRWDYGLMARLGLQFYFPWGALEAKAFYSYGYGNLFLNKSQALELSQNRVYGATVGYLYFFGKEKMSNDE